MQLEFVALNMALCFVSFKSNVNKVVKVCNQFLTNIFLLIYKLTSSRLFIVTICKRTTKMNLDLSFYYFFHICNILYLKFIQIRLMVIQNGPFNKFSSIFGIFLVEKNELFTCRDHLKGRSYEHIP
jgi:hypothetical protein